MDELVSQSSLRQNRALLNREMVEVRSAEEMCKRKRARLNSAWRITERMERIACICVSVCGGDASAAAEYLAAVARQYHWPPKERNELIMLAEKRFLDADMFALASWVDFEEPANVDECRVALRYAREQCVVSEALRANARGFAPSSASLIAWANAFSSRFPVHCRPHALGATGAVDSKKWLRKLRSRWQGKLKVVPTIAPLEIKDFQLKARRGFLAFSSNYLRLSLAVRGMVFADA